MNDSRCPSKVGMTYDKVQFALNKHHYIQKRNSEHSKPVNPAEEVETVSISPVRRKRHTLSCEATLPNISEVAEEKHDPANAFPNGDRKSRQEHAEAKCSNENEQSAHYETKKQEKVDIKANKNHTERQEKEKETPSKCLVEVQESTSEEMSNSTRSRRLSGSGIDVNHSDKSGDSGSNSGVNATEINDVFESDSKKGVRKVPNLNISEDYVQKRKSKVKRILSKGSNKGTGFGSPLSEYTNDISKDPNVKCEHMLATHSSTQDIILKTTYEVHENKTIAPNKCMICEVTEATAKYASVEANRLLLEIVYPHEFYDKFQRSGKKTKVISNPKNLDTNKEQISICKPVSVASKPWRREKTTILPSQPSAPDHSDPPNTVRETYRNRLRERSDQDLSPQKRIKRDGDGESRKEVHLQCKAKNNALVVTDDSAGQKLVLKGLKGWILKKDEVCKNKMHKEIKKSLYQVNSLGMKFSIPEYNTSLSDRKLQSARVFTYITTPCPLDVQQPIRKSVTQSTSPRNNVTYQTPPRDAQTRPLNGLQRGYTHVPKLFSDTAKDSFKGFHLTKVTTNSDGSPSENGISFHKGSTKLSLPPITNDLKSRSLTLSQF